MKCANCQSDLFGEFCAHCGQAAKSRRGPIWQVVAEFSEEVFAPRSKLITSLFTLLFKPGLLSRKFLDGKRVSVLPPVRMYLVISLAFFIVFEIPDIDVSEQNIYIGGILLGHETPIEGRPTFSVFGGRDPADPVNVWFAENFSEKIPLLKQNNAQVTMERILNRLEDLLPNVLILFLPLFALLLKGLYCLKRILYFDHLIFALHFQTWLMVMIIIIYALATINLYFTWLTILIPIYLAKAQKVAYDQSYWWVVPKTCLIFVIYILLITVVAAGAILGAIVLL
ncbi:DUF3667 domain-containing protein [Aliikangiella sp. G2MR2-5]|uniref:DUF3667 domain-containing protein n=1 Tax=Aliikangiella sp. G2MR2-5 TaxID=2788943 RepID=UPI0018A9BA6C|nr:DUF3667 domain-containing protein [Aliikangiella sp. G2MR2-5]